MQLRFVALIVTLLPMLTISLSFYLSIDAGLVEACVPFLEGCTSISGVARKGDAIFIFRPGMMISSVFLVCYWYLVQQWLNQLIGRSQKSLLIMFWLGTLGALFLILYADFLGTDGRSYRLMRRYGITFFFSFTLLAEFIQLRQQLLITKSHDPAPFRQQVVTVQYVICVFILI